MAEKPHRTYFIFSQNDFKAIFVNSHHTAAKGDIGLLKVKDYNLKLFRPTSTKTVKLTSLIKHIK